MYCVFYKCIVFLISVLCLTCMGHRNIYIYIYIYKYIYIYIYIGRNSKKALTKQHSFLLRLVSSDHADSSGLTNS